MKWLLPLLIAAPCIAQPVERIIDAKTPAELVRIMDEWTRSRPMGLHTATFDNGQTLTGSMAATFDRDTATYNWDPHALEGDATAVTTDAPRYGGDIAVYGAPTVETIDATSGGWRVYSAGNDANGLPVVVVRYAGTATMIVYRDGATPSELSSTDLRGGTNKPAATIDDILAGQTDEEADYCHGPRGGLCLPGLIVLNCCTYKYDGSGDREDASNYAIDGVSLVYSTDNGTTWGLAWRSGNINGATPPDDYGAEWSITAVSHERDGSEDDYWISVGTYASGGTRGGDSFICRATGGAGSWTIGNAYQIASDDGLDTNTHIHYAICHEDPANTSGLKVLVERGDTRTDNGTEEWLCSSKSGFLTGASAVSGSANVVTGGSNWSGPVFVNGSITDTGTNASQTVGFAPGPAKGWYSGVDEGVGGPVLYATVPATDGARIDWQNAYSVFGTSRADGDTNWRCFTLNGWDLDASNPAVCGMFGPGNEWDTGNGKAGRIVYKPADSTVFGTVYCPLDEPSLGAQLRPVLSPSGYIWLGTGDDNGLRRFLAPSTARTRVQQAIYAGPGGNNEVLATIVQQNAPGAGNTVSLVDSPPVTFPSTGTVMHFTSNGSPGDNSGLGIWRITGNAIAKTHSKLTIQVVLYRDTAAADADTDTYFRARVYSLEGTNSLATAYVGPNRIEPRGGFLLLTYEFLNGSGLDWDVTGATDSDGLRILFQMQANSGAYHQAEWWMQFVGVYEDINSPPSYFVPPETNGDNESLLLSGFTCGSAWTAYLIGTVGETGRDSRDTGSGTYRAVATLYESASKYIEIRQDADGGFAVHVQDDSTNPTFTATGGPLSVRGDPILVALSWDGSAYTCRYSVAGQATQTLTMGSGAAVAPVSIKAGSNAGGTAFEATRWLYAAVDDSAAASVGNLESFVGNGAVVQSQTIARAALFPPRRPVR
jgi:hypothetical protein